jgi:hypothetical protein
MKAIAKRLTGKTARRFKAAVMCLVLTLTGLLSKMTFMVETAFAESEPAAEYSLAEVWKRFRQAEENGEFFDSGQMSLPFQSKEARAGFDALFAGKNWLLLDEIYEVDDRAVDKGKGRSLISAEAPSGSAAYVIMERDTHEFRVVASNFDDSEFLVHIDSPDEIIPATVTVYSEDGVELTEVDEVASPGGISVSTPEVITSPAGFSLMDTLFPAMEVFAAEDNTSGGALVSDGGSEGSIVYGDFVASEPVYYNFPEDTAYIGEYGRAVVLEADMPVLPIWDIWPEIAESNEYVGVTNGTYADGEMVLSYTAPGLQSFYSNSVEKEFYFNPEAAAELLPFESEGAKEDFVRMFDGYYLVDAVYSKKNNPNWPECMEVMTESEINDYVSSASVVYTLMGENSDRFKFVVITRDGEKARLYLESDNGFLNVSAKYSAGLTEKLAFTALEPMMLAEDDGGLVLGQDGLFVVDAVYYPPFMPMAIQPGTHANNVPEVTKNVRYVNATLYDYENLPNTNNTLDNNFNDYFKNVTMNNNIVTANDGSAAYYVGFGPYNGFPAGYSLGGQNSYGARDGKNEDSVVQGIASNNTINGFAVAEPYRTYRNLSLFPVIFESLKGNFQVAINGTDAGTPNGDQVGLNTTINTATVPVDDRMITAFPNYEFPFIYNDSSRQYSFDSNNYHIHFNATPQNNATITTKTLRLYSGRQNLQNGGAGGIFPFNMGDNVPNNNLNYYFGIHFSEKFLMPKDGLITKNDPTDPTDPMVFTFSGDDDLWVYVDNRLVLDIGGIHSARSGTIDFNSGTVTVNAITVNGINGIFSRAPGDTYPTDDPYPYNYYTAVNHFFTVDQQKTLYDIFPEINWQEAGKEHTIDIFYMERGAGDSNCVINFNLPILPKENHVDLRKYTDPLTDSDNNYLFDVYEYTPTGSSAATPPANYPTVFPAYIPTRNEINARQPIGSYPVEYETDTTTGIKHYIIALKDEEVQQFFFEFPSTVTNELKTYYRFIERPGEYRDGAANSDPLVPISNEGYSTNIQVSRLALPDSSVSPAPPPPYGVGSPFITTGLDTGWQDYSSYAAAPYTVDFTNTKQTKTLYVKKLLVEKPTPAPTPGSTPTPTPAFNFTLEVESDSYFRLRNPNVTDSTNENYYLESVPDTPAGNNTPEQGPYRIIYPSDSTEPGNNFTLAPNEQKEFEFILDADPNSMIIYKITENLSPAQSGLYTTTVVNNAELKSGTDIEGYIYYGQADDSVVFTNSETGGVNIRKITDYTQSHGVGAEFDIKDIDITPGSVDEAILYYVYTVNVLRAPADTYFNLVTQTEANTYAYERAEQKGLIVERQDNICAGLAANGWTMFTIKSPIPNITLQINGNGISDAANTITSYQNYSGSPSRYDQSLFVLTPEYCNVYLDNTNDEATSEHTLYVTAQGNTVEFTDIGRMRWIDSSRVNTILDSSDDSEKKWSASTFSRVPTITPDPNPNDGLDVPDPPPELIPLNGQSYELREWYILTKTYNTAGQHWFRIQDPSVNYFIYNGDTGSSDATFNLDPNSVLQQGRVELISAVTRQISPDPSTDPPPTSVTYPGLLPGHTYEIKETYVDLATYIKREETFRIQTTDSADFSIYWANGWQNQPYAYITRDGKTLVINNDRKGYAAFGQVVVKKEINRAWMPHGNPIFNYKLEQFEEDPSPSDTSPNLLRTYYGSIEFKEQAEGDAVHSDIAAGTYEFVFRDLEIINNGNSTYFKITELDSLRYSPKSFTEEANGAHGNSIIDGIFVLNNSNPNGVITFENVKVNEQKYSHTDLASNIFALPAHSTSGTTTPTPPPPPLLRRVVFHAQNRNDPTDDKYYTIEKIVVDGAIVKMDDISALFEAEHGFGIAADTVWDTGESTDPPNYFSDNHLELYNTPINYPPRGDNVGIIQLDVYAQDIKTYTVQILRYKKDAAEQWGWFRDEVIESAMGTTGAIREMFELPVGPGSSLFPGVNDVDYVVGWLTTEPLTSAGANGSHVSQFTDPYGKQNYVIKGDLYPDDENADDKIYMLERVGITYNYIYPNNSPNGEYATGISDVSALSYQENRYKGIEEYLPGVVPEQDQDTTAITANNDVAWHSPIVERINAWLPDSRITVKIGDEYVDFTVKEFEPPLFNPLDSTQRLNYVAGWHYLLPVKPDNGWVWGVWPTNEAPVTRFTPTAATTFYAEWKYDADLVPTP